MRLQLNFENFLSSESVPPQGGFSVHYFLAAFNDTFYKSSKDQFDSYLNEFSHVKKWIICSDYALYDKRKKNDVITFSLIPYILNFEDYSKLINSLSPRDLKKTKAVNNKFFEFLIDGPIFNISICLDRHRRLHTDEKYFFQKKYEMMVKQLNVWCETTSEHAAHYQELIKKIEILHSTVSSLGANFKVLRDIEILSSLAAYIAFEVTKKIHIEKIGWFSDRDSLLSFKAGKFKTPIIFDLVHHLYYLFCESEGINSKENLVLGVPDDGSQPLWYDALNRIPDLLAGTLSDLDLKSNLCSHDKFIPVRDKLFTNEARNIFFNIRFTKEQYSVGRLTWQTEQNKTK